MNDSTRELRDAYRFPGFTPVNWVEAHPDDPKGVIVELRRRQKGGVAVNAVLMGDATMSGPSWSVTWTAAVGMRICGSD